MYARDRGARDPPQDCGISDISSYDMGSPYLVLSKEGSTPDGGHVEVEVEEEGTDEVVWNFAIAGSVLFSGS